MQSEQRIKILNRIKENEKAKLWDKDVEDDPPTIPLTADKADYLSEKPFAKLLTKISNKMAISFFEKQIKEGNLIIKDVKGLENFSKISGGAIVTCNHFSISDHYAIYRSIVKELPKGHELYKVVREGNYTSFKGLFGFFFRHCNTLPLSRNMETMIKFMKSGSVLLKRGEKILIYPEQAMWWNYRKPRPMKNGAFKLASKNNVPVIPAFITMEDTDKLDGDGFPVQAYTVWFLPAIYPKNDLSEKENADYLKDENYRMWKELYEKVYGQSLTYEE